MTEWKDTDPKELIRDMRRLCKEIQEAQEANPPIIGFVIKESLEREWVETFKKHKYVCTDSTEKFMIDGENILRGWFSMLGLPVYVMKDEMFSDGTLPGMNGEEPTGVPTDMMVLYNVPVNVRLGEYERVDSFGYGDGIFEKPEE